MMKVQRDKDKLDLSELDRLVGEEFDALAGRRQGKTARADRSRPEEAPEGEDKIVYPSPFSEKRRSAAGEVDVPAGDHGEGAGEVVGFEPRGEPAHDGLFSPGEENFIKSTSDWLRGRENADLVLEEIWRTVVAAEVDDILSADESGPDDGTGDDLADCEPGDESEDPDFDEDRTSDDPDADPDNGATPS